MAEFGGFNPRGFGGGYNPGFGSGIRPRYPWETEELRGDYSDQQSSSDPNNLNPPAPGGGGGGGQSWMRNPFYLALIQAGLSFAGNMFSGGDGEGEDRESFADPNLPQSRSRSEAIDPRTQLYRALQAMYGVGGALRERASQPVSLRSSYVQAPSARNIPGLGSVGGDALAQDPALADPSLLSLEGLNLPENLFPDLLGSSVPTTPGAATGRTQPRSTGAGVGQADQPDPSYVAPWSPEGRVRRRMERARR